MAFQIDFTDTALRELAEFDIKTQRRIRLKIDALAQNPYPRGWERVQGKEHRARIRVGRIRVIYDIAKDARSIIVRRVRPRDPAYRGM
jgi:mRNA interferase RelE/StbE